MPRYARGVLLPPVVAERPRRASVYRTLRNAVLEGVLVPGDQLPSSRRAAADYGVSRGLLEEVYSQLMEEGFLERGVGRGTFIASQVSRLPPPSAAGRAPQRMLSASVRGLRLAGNLTCREPEEFKPFNAGVADTSEFPWKAWQRLQGRAVRDLKRADMNFADPRGLAALRAALAHYLATLRGARGSPKQVNDIPNARRDVHSGV